MDTLDLGFLPEPTREAPRVGKDELNLAEFPFALLHTRPPKNAPLKLEFKDGEKSWAVEGSPTYGLPMATDITVYIILMELTREQNYPSQVEFTRYDLIRRLGWGDSGRSYERLTLSLDRLVGVTIRTRNAFYDARVRRWERQKAFHILEAYDLVERRENPGESLTLFPSWIRWSPEMYANMQAGYIKSLDVTLFLSLRSAISQALYRYLDKKRYDGKPVYRIALRTLAFEHLGLSRGYYPSEVKYKLKPAHEELVAVGFLAEVDYAAMKSGEEMVVYRFAPRPEGSRSNRPAPPPTAMDPLVARLIEAGVSRQSAQDLVKGDPEECERQLDYLPHREARDSGAVLAKAIREGWSAPPAWLQAQEVKKKAEKSRKKEAEAATRAREQAEAEAAFDAWWAALPSTRQEEITAQAVAQLRRENRVLAEFASKHPESPIFQGALRPLLKKLAGWPGITNTQ